MPRDALAAIGLHKEEEACPPCELLFRNLEPTGSDGKLSQVVRVQERGEPKSGTGMMFDWATGGLVRTCEYLQFLFGEETCRLCVRDRGYGLGRYLWGLSCPEARIHSRGCKPLPIGGPTLS